MRIKNKFLIFIRIKCIFLNTYKKNKIQNDCDQKLKVKKIFKGIKTKITYIYEDKKYI